MPGRGGDNGPESSLSGLRGLAADFRWPCWVLKSRLSFVQRSCRPFVPPCRLLQLGRGCSGGCPLASWEWRLRHERPNLPRTGPSALGHGPGENRLTDPRKVWHVTQVELWQATYGQGAQGDRWDRYPKMLTCFCVLRPITFM